MVCASSPATEAVRGAESFACAWPNTGCVCSATTATANNGDRNIDFMILPFRAHVEWRILAPFINFSQVINVPLMTKVASVGNTFCTFLWKSLRIDGHAFDCGVGIKHR